MKMGFQILQTILQCFVVYSLAFDDFIYVYGEGNKEMKQQGRVQYQIIKERGTLPKYGPCWRAALEHINEGCRHLSEDTQSDIALHITNCFLEMSGHETYNCGLDRKANSRGICINNMSDRAFKVYTEFYTHTQNICWFLRGQIWHETIAENTLKVGKLLQISEERQQDLIRLQKESIELQEKMLHQGIYLEKVLKDVYMSSQAHRDVLKLMTQSVTTLQAWMVGEISWIDSIIFNVSALLLIFVITSSPRTIPARLPLFFLLFLNMVVERLICSLYTKYSGQLDTQNLYTNLYTFVWYSRYAFTFLGAVVIVYVAITCQDILQQNLETLNNIKDQNKDILRSLEKFKRCELPLVSSTSVDYIGEQINCGKRNFIDVNSSPSFNRSLGSNTREMNIDKFDREGSADMVYVNSSGYHSSYTKRKHIESQNRKYNLRSHSRQGSPDSGVVH